jgi:hypothetical protein
VRRRWWRPWFVAALAGSALLGCEHAPVKPSYPPDPLFLSKKPVAGNVEKAQTVVACREPAVPPLPPGALATAPPQRGVPFDPGSAVAQDAPAVPRNPPAAPPPVQKITALASTGSTDRP